MLVCFIVNFIKDGIKPKKKKKDSVRDFPGGPLVKNLPCNPGDMGLIPGLGMKIPHAVEQFSPHHN